MLQYLDYLLKDKKHGEEAKNLILSKIKNDNIPCFLISYEVNKTEINEGNNNISNDLECSIASYNQVFQKL
jgi:hypothetical protein